MKVSQLSLRFTAVALAVGCANAKLERLRPRQAAVAGRAPHDTLTMSQVDRQARRLQQLRQLVIDWRDSDSSTDAFDPSFFSGWGEDEPDSAEGSEGGSQRRWNPEDWGINLDDWNLGGLLEKDDADNNNNNNNSTDGHITDLLCPVLEFAIDMSPDFGRVGNCECDGNLRDGMSIACDFYRQCIEIADILEICGQVALTFAFDDAGTVNVGVGVDIDGDDYEQIYFQYGIAMLDRDRQTCIAKYGGKPCSVCTIDRNFCFALDCSEHLDGVAMDTCQQLDMRGDNAASFLPRLRMFDELLPDFDGSLPSLGEIIDPNFDWGNVEWIGNNWEDIFDIGNVDTCSIVKGLVDITDAFDIDGNCKCSGSFRDGIVLECDFATVCNDGDDPAVGNICASSGFSFAIDSMDAIAVNVTVDFANDDLEEFHLAYNMPLGDPFSGQTCAARIGEQDCTCEIDNLCWTVDCPIDGGRVDTCQFLNFDLQDGPTSFFPRFQRFAPDFEFDWGSWFTAPNFEWASFNFTDWLEENWDRAEIAGTWNEFLDVLELPEIGYCPLLQRAIQMGPGFGDEGECECGGDLTNGVYLNCHFDNECIDGYNCGSVSIDVPFTSVDSVAAKVCVDSTVGIDVLPSHTDEEGDVCYEYSIGIVDRSVQECKAIYRGEQCRCTIDGSDCIQVDCSDVQNGARMETCQRLSLKEASDARMFIPKFDVPVDPNEGADGDDSGGNTDTPVDPPVVVGEGEDDINIDEGNDGKKEEVASDPADDGNGADRSSAVVPGTDAASDRFFVVGMVGISVLLGMVV